MNKYEKKLGEIINKYSLDIELIKPAGANIEVFNLDSVLIKLDKLGLNGYAVRYSEEEKGFDALSCLNKLYGTLQIQIDKFNNITFYQYAIYVNAGEYEDKYECFTEWLDLRDDLGEYLRGNICYE